MNPLMLSLLLGKDASSKTALEQRKKSVLDFVFATLGVQ